MEIIFPDLERYLLDSAPPHVARSIAPETLEDLQAAGPGPMVVWNGASTRTIYSAPEVNYAYRAYHDATHLAHGLTTSLEDEHRVSVLHQEHAHAAGLPWLDRAALWFDSQGQNEYFAKHGEFMTDQRAFVLACMALGLKRTLNTKW